MKIFAQLSNLYNKVMMSGCIESEVTLNAFFLFPKLKIYLNSKI